MLESVRCPSCSTHYGLKASRVKPSTRRAKCCLCETIFGIEQEVQRLLESIPGLEVPEVGIGQAELPPMVEAEELPDLDFVFEENPAISPGDLLEESVEPTHAPEPHVEAMPELELETEAPALTLGDLEGEDLLEKTLVQTQAVPTPEMDRQDAPLPAQEAPKNTYDDFQTDGGGSYSSALDAINKLMGQVPPSQPTTPTRGTMAASRGNQMDVEATLSALEKTLGGAPTNDLSPAAAITPPPMLPGDDATAAATLKLSASDIRAALAPSPRADFPPSPGLPIAPAGRTTAIPQLQASEPEYPSAFPAPPTFESSSSGDLNLLKVQVGAEVFQNLTVEQVTRWIEEGRIMDYHLVARQFSENWIEAAKVPALRPVFERVRRVRANLPEAAPSFAPNETAPIKKSLFGGLFKS